MQDSETRLRIRCKVTASKFVYMHVCVFVLLARNITTALMLFFAYFCIKFTNVAFDLPCLNAISHKIPPLFFFQNSSKNAKINTDIYQFSKTQKSLYISANISTRLSDSFFFTFHPTNLLP